VDGLPRLIDGLLSGEQDGGFVLQLDGLRELGGADGSVSDVADLEVAGEACGEAELRLQRAAPVEWPREERVRVTAGL